MNPFIEPKYYNCLLGVFVCLAILFTGCSSTKETHGKNIDQNAIAKKDTTAAANFEVVNKEAQKKILQMSTEQRDIFEKMLNIMDNYDSVSGTIILKVIGDTEEKRVVYMVDFAKQYSYESAIGSVNNIETYNYDDISTSYDNIGRAYYISNIKMSTDYDPVKTMPVEDRITIMDGYPMYNLRTDITYLPIARASLNPGDIAMKWLRDPSFWTIYGTEEMCGRSCSIVKGQVNPVEKNSTDIDSFVLYVDKETGIIINYECYSPQGELLFYLRTETLSINEPLQPVYIDPNKYNGYSEVPQ